MADKWLLMRFGGIGDLMCCVAAARGIKQIYPEDTIDMGVRTKDQVDLVKNLPIFRKVFELQRFPHPMNGMNCRKIRDGWESMEHVKASNDYTVIVDFVNCIENNTVHPEMVPLYGEWCQSMNSNFVNWLDLHLGWCRIDPQKITPENKRPLYVVEPKERKWAKGVLERYPRPWIGVNLTASSRARTLFDIQSQVNAILEAVPGSTVILREGGQTWTVVRKGGAKPLGCGDTTRECAALIEQFDCFVGADSGFSHIAEAVGTHNVAIYTTVPAWTRNLHYKYSHDLDIEPSCSPCFTLHTLCPINRRRAMESLTERERSVMQYASQGIPPHVAASQMQTTPDKLTQEFNAIQAKLDGVASVIPDCIASATPDLVVEKVKEALDAASKEAVGT